MIVYMRDLELYIMPKSELEEKGHFEGVEDKSLGEEEVEGEKRLNETDESLGKVEEEMRVGFYV